MEQEIEIEFKNLLTPDEFFRLSNKLSLTKESFTSQINHYFDTNDFSLKQHKSALRIREKNGSYMLTLKQPHEDGLLESHQQLTEDEFKSMMDSGLVSGPIHALLSDIGVKTENIHYLGTLATNRAELPYRNGLLVLDENQYLSITDYELEYEAKEKVEGFNEFQSLLKKYEIPERKTANKIQRFFDAKNS